MTNKYFIFCVIIFVLISASNRGQALKHNNFGCSTLTPLNTIDSTVIKADTDSAYIQTTGRWQLILIKSGWGQPQKPTQSVLMSFSGQRQGIIYIGNKLSSTYQLKMIRSYEDFSFSIKESNKPFFDFHASSTGYLRVCEGFLVMGENVGDGREWVFKRLNRN